MIAIIGAGAAGAAAAEALRELGYDGELRLFGSEAAPPYERPTLSKQFLTEPAGDPPTILAAEVLRGRSIDLELGRAVVSIDAARQQLITSDGALHTYDQLLLATGAEPRRLDLSGATLPGVHYLRELDDAQALRAELRPGRRVVVIGGGVIGLEVAASAQRCGCTATVLEVAPQLMGRIVPRELAEVIADLHRAQGVAIRTSVRPAALDGTDHVTGVRLDDGEVVPADAVVIGVGVVPRTRLAEEAGLPVQDGVLVDAHFRSTEPHIYAAGDVARVFHAREQRHIRIEQWRPAQEQGRRVAASMLGSTDRYQDVPWMWSDQHDFEIQMTGFGLESAEIVRRGDPAQRGGLAYIGIRRGQVVGACGVSIGSSIARTIRPAQMLIEQGVAVNTRDLGDPEVDLRAVLRRAKETARQPLSPAPNAPRGEHPIATAHS